MWNDPVTSTVPINSQRNTRCVSENSSPWLIPNTTEPIQKSRNRPIPREPSPNHGPTETWTNTMIIVSKSSILEWFVTQQEPTDTVPTGTIRENKKILIYNAANTLSLQPSLKMLTCYWNTDNSINWPNKPKPVLSGFILGGKHWALV